MNTPIPAKPKPRSRGVKSKFAHIGEFRRKRNELADELVSCKEESRREFVLAASVSKREKWMRRAAIARGAALERLRVKKLRPEMRAMNLAYAFLRGREYATVEKTVRNNLPYNHPRELGRMFKQVFVYVGAYAEKREEMYPIRAADRNKAEIYGANSPIIWAAFDKWLDAAKEHLDLQGIVML